MKFKADGAEAQRRLTALWRRERLDRPCMAVRAPITVEPLTQVPEPADPEARWLDPVFRIALVHRALESTWWGGEAMPSCLQMGAWTICLGGTPRFGAETIWFKTRAVDFSRPSPFRHDPDSVWVRKYRELLLSLCRDAGPDDYLIGSPLLLPANDLLSMHLGTQDFLTALLDHPEWMAEAILNGAHDQLRAWQELQALMRGQRHAYWYGNAGWMPFWAPEPFISSQSDVSCMLSPEMFDRFVLPELDIFGHAHDALWYHLDGGDACQHLPRLLSLPYLRVIQYVPAPCEPANGPGHLALYRRIQAAGKIVHIQLPSDNIEPLVRQLDPALLMLETRCASRAAGEKLLEQSVIWARGAKPASRVESRID